MAISAVMGIASTASYAMTGAQFLGGFLIGAQAGTWMTHFLVTTALGAALNALTPKQTTAARGYRVTQRGTALDHQIIYGEDRVSGAIVYDGTSGDDNKYLHRVIVLAGHEVDSFTGYYVNDQEVTLTSGSGVNYTVEVDATVVGYETYTQVSRLVISGSSINTYYEGDPLTWAELNTLVASGTLESGTVPAETPTPTITVTKRSTASFMVNEAPYTDKIRIIAWDGTQTEADSDLVAEVEEWTDKHILKGLAYVYIRFEYDQEVFQNGIPEVQVKVKGKKVYDPRATTPVQDPDDPTTPVQDPDDPSTWLWSDNPVLCVRDYIVNERFGLGEDPDRIDIDKLNLAANVCDTISLNGNKRFTFNGSFTTGMQPIDFLTTAVSSFGGLIWYAQGKWRFKAAAWTAPVATFTEDDFRSSLSVTTRHSRRDNYNRIRGTFRGPESNYKQTEYPDVTNHTATAVEVSAASLTYGEWYEIKTLGDTDWNAVAATEGITYSVGTQFVCVEPTAGVGSTGVVYETTNTYLDVDGGVDSAVDLDLPFTNNSDEARRIARISLERNRQQITFSASFSLKALKVQIGDNINITYDRFGWTNKTFEVIAWEFGMDKGLNLQVSMTLRETTESAFDEFDDAYAYSSGSVALPNYELGFDVVNLQVATVTGNTPTFELTWDQNNAVRYYSVRWRPTSEVNYVGSATTTNNYYTISGVNDDTEYTIVVVPINIFGAEGYASKLTATFPSTKVTAGYYEINILDVLTSASFAGDVTINADLLFEDGENRITYNDGGGNFNIRSGHYYDVTTDYRDEYTTTGKGAIHAKFAHENPSPNFSIKISEASANAVAGAEVVWSKTLYLDSDGTFTWGTDNVFHDSYHPYADALTTARNISLSGDVSGSVSFDGSGDVDISTTATSAAGDFTVTGDLTLLGGEIFFNSSGVSGDYLSYTTQVGLTYYENGNATWRLSGNGNNFINGGFLGINISNPTQRLHVNGNTQVDGNIYVNGTVDGVDIAAFKTSFDNDTMTKKSDIPDAANLNDYTIDGYYHQNLSAYAANGTNYPANLAGMLEVMSDGNMVYQRYTTYNSTHTQYIRTQYNGTWYSWATVWTNLNDGAGSGLSADNVDGYHLDQDVRTTASPTFANATISNDLVVTGNLSVLGDVVVINAQELTVEDKNITVASGATNATEAHGAGINVGGVGAAISYNGTYDRWDMNRGLGVSGVFYLVPMTQPSSPYVGMTYMDSSDNIIYTWDGSNWRPHYGNYLKLE